jgi:hypothetical protein
LQRTTITHSYQPPLWGTNNVTRSTLPPYSLSREVGDRAGYSRMYDRRQRPGLALLTSYDYYEWQSIITIIVFKSNKIIPILYIQFFILVSILFLTSHTIPILGNYNERQLKPSYSASNIYQSLNIFFNIQSETCIKMRLYQIYMKLYIKKKTKKKNLKINIAIAFKQNYIWFE